MVAYQINPRKTALLVHDMVNMFLKPGFPREQPHIRENLVPRLKRLIEHCRSKDIPVIYVDLALREDGSDAGIMREITPTSVRKGGFIKGTEAVQVYEEIKPQEGDIVIEKHRFSAFRGNELELILRTKGIDTLIITGFSTNVGVDSTVREATDKDFRVILPSDGIGCADISDQGWGRISKEEVQRVFLSAFAERFARVLTIQELISELQ